MIKVEYNLDLTHLYLMFFNQYKNSIDMERKIRNES